MATRADFDAALVDLASAIAAAATRFGSGGPLITDQDIATLKQDTANVNALGTGGGAGTGSISFNPPTVTGGGVVTATITLPSPGTSVEVFDLASDSPDATVQAQVSIGAGASTADFAVNTRPVGAVTKVTITCKSPLHAFSNTFTINP